MRCTKRSALLSFLVLATVSFAPFAALTLRADEARKPDRTAELGARLEPILEALGFRAPRFHLKVTVYSGENGERAAAAATISRFSEGAYAIAIDHKEYPFRIERNDDATLLVLPAHKTVLRGAGAVEGRDTLEGPGLIGRLAGEGSSLFPYLVVLSTSTGSAAAVLLSSLAGLNSEDGVTWTARGHDALRIVLPRDRKAVEISDRGLRVVLERADAEAPGAKERGAPEGFAVKPVDRAEMERTVARGVRRALELLSPSSSIEHPSHEARTVPGGELRWVEEGRLVVLHGTPRQIGEAHGHLLAAEARRCADSVLYLVGAANTVRSGRWFLDDIRDSYRRLEKFIPDSQKEEVEALADASGIGRDEAKLANVFPELFHCSGFAVFGKATVDGKLYHGRVLDYMTAIGLQDAAAVFVVARDGKIPFANVGYAGFVGSVSGMNAKGISLGEMGGRGEGKWDGVPMATLMRRALEECSTLDEVKRLWSESPRTCEYYYVFADGKIPDAVGVSATPEKIEFLKPGEAHPILGEGIPDTVVMSAGDRLKELRKRVTEGHGKFDVETAKGLMCRPVAMTSNLHDVLFVPSDLVLYVANADRKSPAANRPYVRYDLGAILKEAGSTASIPAPAPAGGGR